MPTIQDIIQQFQAELDAQLESAAAQMIDSYRVIYAKLKKQADELVVEIDRLRAAGEEVSLNRIRKMERYQRLVRETKQEMDKYAAIIEDSVRRNGPGAAMLGTQQARGVVRQMLAIYPAPVRDSILATFQQLPRDAIAAMVAALQEQSPLAKLLGTFGDEVANGVGESLLRGLAAGYNPRKVARELTREFGLGLTRALRISRTEMIRAHRMGNLAEYRENEHVVKGWRWHAQMDSRTCLSCIAQHGTLHPLSETLDDHPNGRCHPSGVLVSGPRSVAATSRHYCGQLLTIRTASGNELAITPNHPILTDRGWIAGNLLREGDNIICCTISQETAAAIYNDDYQMPTAIEKIVESFGVVTAKMPCTPKDFHGDGIGSDVYVIRADRLLGDNAHTALFEPLAHHDLGGRHIAEMGLAVQRSFAQLLKWYLLATHAILRNFDAAMMFFYWCLRSKKAVSGCLIPNFCAAIQEARANGTARNGIAPSQGALGLTRQVATDNRSIGQSEFGASRLPGLSPDQPIPLFCRSEKTASLEDITQALAASAESAREVIHAIAGNIAFDRVLNIGVRAFEGHVYSLQTRVGWYIANGVLVHNCTAIPETVNFRDLGIDLDDPEPVVREGDGQRWFEAQPEAVQREMMGPEKWQAWREGKFDFSRLSKAVDDPDWGRSFVEASLKDLAGEA